MYGCYREGLVEGRESFSGRWILGENLLFLVSWVLAGWLLWPVQVAGWPVATLGWAAFVLTAQVLLKRHLCTGCYYYGKPCHLGWGRLAAALFRPDAGNPRVGMALAVPMYMASPPLIVAAAGVIRARARARARAPAFGLSALICGDLWISCLVEARSPAGHILSRSGR